jgi:hypothetical protein
MRVAAEPTFAAHASASRNGSGSSLRRPQPSMSTGVIARQTMSFVRTALKSPARPTTRASRRVGETLAATMRRETCV